MKNVDAIEKILSEYLDRKSFNEYSKLLSENKKTRRKKVSSINSESSKQLNQKLTSSSDYNSYIEFLITFAKRKLANLKFIELLLFLGDISTQKGELDSAVSLFKNLISYTNKKSKYINVAAYSMMALGEIYSRQADWVNSKNYIRKANKVFQEQNDYKGIAKCENLLGTIYGDKGDLNIAQKHFEFSLSFLNPKRDKTIYGMLEMNLGILNNILQNYDEAYNYYQRALIIFEKDNNLRRMAEVTGNIGVLYLQKGEYNFALKSFDKSFMFAQKADVLNPMCVALLNKALIYTKLKDYPLANVFADKAIEIAYKINDRLSIADIYKIKGIIERCLGNYTLAENHLLTSIRINTELENLLNLAETNYEIGLLYNDMRKPKETRKHLNSALTKFKQLKMNEMVKKVKNDIPKSG
ncbi:MAG: tetratricopeptide repeat protein [Bacteroidetes bacterium]|nr:tetratricopeptide repeat protein [Bacteroidota bacterium]